MGLTGGFNVMLVPDNETAGTGNGNVALVVSENDAIEGGAATDCAFIFWLLRVSQWKDQSTVDTAARYLQYLSHL